MLKTRQPSFVFVLPRTPASFFANRKLESSELCKNEPITTSSFGGKRERVRSSFGGRRTRIRRARSITRRRRLRDLISRSNQKFLRLSLLHALRKQYIRLNANRFRQSQKLYLRDGVQSSAFRYSRGWRGEKKE